MSWVAAAVAGAAVIGGVASNAAANKQAGAAKNASDAQLQATEDTNNLQYQMYLQNLQNEKPYQQSGNLALAALTGGLGLAGGGGGFNTGGNSTGNVAGASTLGGDHAGATYSNLYNDTIPDGGGTNAYYGNGVQNYGASAQQMNDAANQYQGAFTQTFTPSDLTIDPSYQFRLDQGQKALQASAAARGGLLTGQGAADITNYAQGAASQEYQAAFDRFQTTQNNSYNRLAALAGVGQTAVANDNAAGTSTAQGISANTNAGVGASNNYLTSGAASQAAGIQAIGNDASSAANTYAAYKAFQTKPQTQAYSPYTPAYAGGPDTANVPVA